MVICDLGSGRIQVWGIQGKIPGVHELIYSCPSLPFVSPRDVSLSLLKTRIPKKSQWQRTAHKCHGTPIQPSQVAKSMACFSCEWWGILLPASTLRSVSHFQAHSDRGSEDSEPAMIDKNSFYAKESF